jgi:tripartite-type tricarboxylate transporter receptor subunit TctC
MRNTGYDPLADFTHVGMDTQLPQVLVASPSAEVSTIQELIDAMRRQPGKLNYGSGGAGSVGHLAAELFKQRIAAEPRPSPRCCRERWNSPSSPPPSPRR